MYKILVIMKNRTGGGIDSQVLDFPLESKAEQIYDILADKIQAVHSSITEVIKLY
ncbi:hypothetical protein KNT87_gp028 [Erwinia phage Cronus]|uniref:Uncharacterized protein n=1 Tax=Erwinia phage Cronus TaxID=2163633 RepID=A0A2S1GM49_9CAUD|nr:hypothetical protein KNT87_gp028 [Erwinia phage Cronus]AWD90467.1 hypothetical protein [Erwinia phage Cronus]